ncbi:MAG: hypothetical protein HQK53_13040, partial [Oligoflexia bacterium]|nr:hypothetical protein [Oligoflexia bacterium]
KLFLEVGNDYDRSELLRQLVVMQYTRDDFDLTRGIKKGTPACKGAKQASGHSYPFF